ncbi:MAG: PIN domain-containing protein [Bacteroidales bacterium]|nr:PIN domain-containing protein [Bacteroidales bacterium]
MTKIEQYIKFFDLQRRDQEAEYEEYAKTPMSSLFAGGEAYYGEIMGIDKSGKIVMHFSSSQNPRLKVPMVFCVLKDSCGQELGLDFSRWSINSIDFRSRTCHSSFSDATPIYAMKDDKKTIACDKIDLLMYQAIDKALQNNRKLKFVMLKTLPPTELLKNLKEYIQIHPEDEELLLEAKRTYDEWNPLELGSTEQVDEKVLSSLKKDGIAILQGPPGTGKSYTIASIITKVASEGKNICVTTQSNASLISLISQDPIKEYRGLGRISKTNITTDESREFPKLKGANKDLTIPKGELLCSTYYSLSRVINKSDSPLYDLIIIEEASQAYLTAIAAFKKLGKMCLIVGDPMQLPPVVKIDVPADYEGIDIETQANGMMTTLRATDIMSFRITTSYRLTGKSARQSSVFYNGHLLSVQKDIIDFSLVTERPVLFPQEGGTIILKTMGASSAILSTEALEIMKYVEREFKGHYPTRKLAILTPYVETTKKLQAEFCKDEQTLDITVDTIHRIQGLTVDYTIYYVPTRNYNFAFSDNLFNVATSRSRSTTLLLTDLPLEMMPIKSTKVRAFMAGCDIINNGGKTSNQNDTQEAHNAITTETSKERIVPKVIGFVDPSTFERKRKEIVSDKKNIYVIDTNVFVNYPDIISKIGDKYSIALAAKVVDELDRMKIKLDEQGKRNAEKAIRNINNVKRDIMFELSDVSLLPSDFDKRSPDNMILSVAMKLKDDNPILLTSDNGLQVKAKILGFKTISLKDFLRK